MTKRMHVLLFGILLGVLSTVSGVALGDADTGRDRRVPNVVAEGYARETTTSLYRETLDGGEGQTDLGHATITAVQELTVGGFGTVRVSGRFSASGATCAITVTRWHKAGDGTLTFKSREAAVTLTAGTDYTISSLYPSGTEAFDTAGCDVIKVLAADPSSGTVSLFVEVY